MKLIYIILTILTIIQGIIFAVVYNYYNTSPLYRCTCKKYEIPFPLSRTSAALINFSLVFSLLSIVRLPKRWFFIPFKLISLHIYFAICLIIWSIVHTVSHYRTFLKFRYSLFTSGVGLTGHILLILLLSVFVMSLPYIRRTMYQCFLYFHYIFLVLFTGVLLVHGNLCFLKNDSKNCLSSSSWMWLIAPLLYIVIYTIYKFTKRVKMLSSYDLKNGICELKLDLSKEYEGKTIWLCCPQISYLEWHPFTVAFYANNGCYLYFKKRGDFTTELSNKIEKGNVTFLVEGPYHAVPKNMMKEISEKQVVLISSGVGITTFIQVYRQIAKNLKRNTNFSIKKLYIYIIVRHEHELNWVMDLFNMLNVINNVIIKIYYTGEESYKLVNLNIPHSIGRPEFKDIFEYHIKNENTEIYYSGKTSLGRQIEKFCKYKDKFKFRYVN